MTYILCGIIIVLLCAIGWIGYKVISFINKFKAFK